MPLNIAQITRNSKGLNQIDSVCASSAKRDFASKLARLLTHKAGTRAEAQTKFDQLQELVDPLAGLGSLYSTFGDLSGYPPDGPVPEV